MIITRTPFRVSFFGGGTDYPAWYNQHGGAVLSMAINRYCYLTVRHLPPFFEHKHRVVYSKVELVDHAEQIQHPVVRAIMLQQNIESGLEIHHDADLPARSGMGSSSSFTVGFLKAIYALQGKMISNRTLAAEAINIEQNVLKENVGSQDQLAAAWGGFNHIEFEKGGDYSVNPVILSADRYQELESSIILFFTGIQRFASNVAGKKIANFDKRQDELTTMHGMVNEALSILNDQNQPIENFGTLLNESWKLKRSLSDAVTNPLIDEIYAEAIAAGASGGKLMGAGAGGFMVFIVHPSLRRKVCERLSRLIHVDCAIDHGGSQVVAYDPERQSAVNCGV
ncbi:GHMP family kinase ATP-binding protein [Magnetococcus sp. PR-3]|uniref:GHMP family kinase ATP-binding protein n=1 Tax=Magnetococcus sp. PR-3 TaxID=3120355 RepID=UPI002FCE0329